MNLAYKRTSIFLVYCLQEKVRPILFFQHHLNKVKWEKDIIEKNLAAYLSPDTMIVCPIPSLRIAV